MAERLALYLAPPKDELAERILELFFVRRDVYGVEMAQGWITVKEPVTLELVRQHLNGGPCLGAHPISANNRCRWIGWDFDTKEKADLVYSKAVAKYPKSSVLLNSTGGRGYHIRVFFDRLIPAAVAHRLAKKLVEGLEGVEYYPKQAGIGAEGSGNFMRLPLGRHRKSSRVGVLIFPETLMEIKQCSPPVPLTFEEIVQDCPDHVQDLKGYCNCRAIDGTVGYCRPQLCPKVKAS